MTKKIISIISAIILAVTTLSTAFAVEYGAEIKNQPTKIYTQTFSDVPESHWAAEYISEMVSRGILSGYPDGAFRPDNTVTRAEFAKIMTVAAGISIEPVTQVYFNDTVQDAWYTPYVNAARNYLSGYTTPYGSHYYSEQPALREDIAVALVKLKGYDTFGADESMLTAMFSDVASISESARKYVATAIEKGLVSGYDDGTFRGQATITRAEAATMLWRAYQYGNENKQFDITEPVATPVPTIPPTTIPTIAPTVVPTPESTTAPTPEPTTEPTPIPELTTTASPEPEKEYVVERIAEVDKNNYMTYNSGENVVYYYKDGIINEYDVDSGKNSAFMDCSEFKFTADDNSNYYKDLKMEQMYYDNYRNRLYITMNATKKSDMGGLEDVACDKELYFYIENGEISELVKKGYIFGACEEGTIGRDANGAHIFDANTGDSICRLGDSDVSIIINNGCKYSLTKSYNSYTSASLIKYDFSESETIRSIAVASRYSVADNDFYVWDVDGRIIKCDLDGNLSVLLDVNTDVKIKDMMSIKNYCNYGDFIITDDDNIIFYQDNYLRIIKKV